MSEFLTNSPATVELAAFDAFWASELPEHDAFFEDLAMPLKPLDLSVAIATSGADEDAWLFGDKTAFAVREIRVKTEPETPATSSSAPATPTPTPTPMHQLTIEVQQTHALTQNQDDDDTTSVLLAPVMGSPVDELDAMAAFMVDDVDPFQEVVVTSDDEPCLASPILNLPTPRTRQYCSLTEEKKLDKLRTTVAHLEKMYYARCHGRATTATSATASTTASGDDSGIHIARVKMVRSIERLQRIAADVAQENYGFRRDQISQRAREELFLLEMAGVLKSPMAREQLCSAIADKCCSDAIVATAHRSAEAAMDLSVIAGEPLLGWDCRKRMDASLTTSTSTGVLTYATKKDFGGNDYTRVTTSAWQTLLVSEQFAALMTHGAGATRRSHVLKRLSDDALLLAFDTVVAPDVAQAAAVAREVCVAFRVRTTSGVMVGLASVAPSLYERHVYPLHNVTYTAHGMRWLQFAQQSPTAFSVTAGGRVECASQADGERVHVAALALLMQWERAHFGATTLLL